jgi:cytochrome c biogenesis protein CcmG, thiol:disulfide interchange protein DsbE
VPRLLRHPAPAFEVTTLRGEHFSNAELKGKVAVVNLWATWCAACLEELPALQEFQEEHPEVVVLTVVEKDTKEKDLRGVIREKKLKTLRIGEAPFELWQQFGAFGVPNTFVVDKNGNVRTQHNGMEDVGRYLTADLQAIGAAGN